jgi:type I restriction enzyme, S subunit
MRGAADSVSAKWPKVKFGEVLLPVSRPELVCAEGTYRVLGAHWYGKGLYVKAQLNGSDIQAQRLYRVEIGDFVYNRLFAWKGSFALATDNDSGASRILSVTSSSPVCVL